MNARPYLGRYVEPPPRPSPEPLPLADRIALMLTAARYARLNAHNAMRAGDYREASHAFYRAHSHLEYVRKMRAEQ